LPAIGCVRMPRAKADNVVIHRIEFGGKERELLEGATAAWQFNRISTPIVAALSDVSFLVFVGGLLAAYKIIDEEYWKSISGSFSDAATTASEVANGIIGGIENAQRKRKEAGEWAEGVIDDRNLIQFLFEEGTILGRIFR
jgi:hypothetical protein